MSPGEERGREMGRGVMHEATSIKTSCVIELKVPLREVILAFVIFWSSLISVLQQMPDLTQNGCPHTHSTVTVMNDNDTRLQG